MIQACLRYTKLWKFLRICLNFCIFHYSAPCDSVFQMFIANTDENSKFVHCMSVHLCRRLETMLHELHRSQKNSFWNVQSLNFVWFLFSCKRINNVRIECARTWSNYTVKWKMTHIHWYGSNGNASFWI